MIKTLWWWEEVIAQSVGHRSAKQRLPSSNLSINKQMGDSMAAGEGAEAPTNTHTAPQQARESQLNISPIPRHPCGAKLLPANKLQKNYFILAYKHWDQYHNFSWSLDIAGSLPLIPGMCSGSRTHGTINTFTVTVIHVCSTISLFQQETSRSSSITRLSMFRCASGTANSRHLLVKCEGCTYFINQPYSASCSFSLYHLWL